MWSAPRSERDAVSLPAVAALALLAFGVACSPPQHVGRPCELGTAAAGGASGQIATLSSPALECPSRVCLLPDQNTVGTGPLCTAECESSEDCQDGETASANDPTDTRCHGGFVCMWPTTVGAFACRKMCVCTDFVSASSGAATKPAACN
jgi:hypothetical protein